MGLHRSQCYQQCTTAQYEKYSIHLQRCVALFYSYARVISYQQKTAQHQKHKARENCIFFTLTSNISCGHEVYLIYFLFSDSGQVNNPPCHYFRIPQYNRNDLNSHMHQATSNQLSSNNK